MKTPFCILLGVLVASSLLGQENLGPLKLVNISCRAYVGESDIIAGFIIQSERRLLIRAVGPTLESFGVRTFCKDPVVTLYNGQTIVTENDNWDSTKETADIFTKAGAFFLHPQTKDAAIIITLGPGVYTVATTCAPGNEGMVLLEVYDLDWMTPRGLSNLSMRGMTGPGDKILIPGIVIGGRYGQSVFLLRAIGPGLEQFGIKNFIPDPKIVLTSGPYFQLENDNWQTQGSNPFFRYYGVFTLPPDSKDSALIFNRATGGGSETTTFTINVRIEDVNDASGIALFEIFLL